jgi:hypothetical protein
LIPGFDKGNKLEAINGITVWYLQIKSLTLRCALDAGTDKSSKWLAPI